MKSFLFNKNLWNLILREEEKKTVEDQLQDIQTRTDKIEKKIGQVLYLFGHLEGHEHSGHHMMGYPDLLNPHSNYMGGGYALPYGMMSPAMMGYGGFGFGYGIPGGMPMGGYNYPDKQDENHDGESLLKKFLKI